MNPRCGHHRHPGIRPLTATPHPITQRIEAALADSDRPVYAVAELAGFTRETFRYRRRHHNWQPAELHALARVLRTDLTAA